jgi:hypothetical protein
MGEVASGDNVSESKSFGPDPRLVEWRGKGYYFVEFNPFLQVFGALQSDTTWKSLTVPIEDPFYANWYSQGRVIGWDSVSVPAGTFKALRVELNSSRQAKSGATIPEPQRVQYVIWYASDAKRTVKHVRTVWGANGARLDDNPELVKYRSSDGTGTLTRGHIHEQTYRRRRSHHNETVDFAKMKANGTLA